MILGWFNKRPRRDGPDIDVNAVISDYGAYLEKHPIALEIRDEKNLPHPKATILYALIIAVSHVGGTQEEREGCISSALCLANFQKGVGNYPAFPLGVDIGEFTLSEMSSENLRRLILADPSGKERYEKLRPLVQDEIHRIGALMIKANQAHTAAASRST